MIDLGFTGTRNGMTDAQRESVRVLLRTICPKRARHGDCVGADAEFHSMIVFQSAFRCEIIVHPCTFASLRAYVAGYDQILHTLPPLERNRAIVDSCDQLFATPASSEEQKKGGTWYTIRYAKQVGKPVTIVWPNGVVERW